ncbi:hypothetical protein IFM89_013133 [Coptis chinensis]|uniref:HXXXD-type acyl-transferase family protein n=1 Tax=Coptis chinensis TaxID=261450 RepID=A0A835HPR5_9MAGN|nr:hypothetical protein IFM89_013133 [Coptis chinensis]
MGSVDVENIIYNIKVSSVVPASVTGEDRVHELSNIDLLMKLHYLKGLYYFDRSAVQGITTADFKLPMFKWLQLYYMAAGRIRKSEADRPFIKCNDSGVRIIEAQSNMTLDECLGADDFKVHGWLLPKQVLGPDLSFSPLVLMQVRPHQICSVCVHWDCGLYVMTYGNYAQVIRSKKGSEMAQKLVTRICNSDHATNLSQSRYAPFTWFKCGGMSVGLSWAHVLGDAFSASNFINIWGQIMAGKLTPNSLNRPKAPSETTESEGPMSTPTEILSFKKIEAIRDSWIAGNNCMMETISFQVTSTQLNHLQSKLSNQSQTPQVRVFEALCTVIWQCLTKIRGNSESRITITCRNNHHNREDEILSNNQILRVVEADSSIMETEPSELAALIVKQLADNSSPIEDTLLRNEWSSDFVVYGTNLTFVDLEDAKLYGLEFKGCRPVFVNYTIDGVGKEGVVLVLPGPKTDEGGRTVTAVLPQNEVMELKYELKSKWGI